ncbi:MAG TPA: HAD family hydrolase [Sumerlaeia bacterium]|nr:HAD family hydrolase [Sumerlaeia bacterium]
MTAADLSPKTLKNYQPTRPFFIGIDSDGCVFDTMELKWKECFIPNVVKHFGLQSISKYAREVTEFVNLYSKWRGINRFPALVRCFDLLRERPEVKKRGVKIPDLAPLERWIEEESKLGNPALRSKVERTGDPTLRMVLEWSLAVNAAIADTVHGVAPFPGVREALIKAGEQADLVVVSQTPGEALTREWREHDLDRLVSLICGQELGTKTDHIRLAAGGKYEAGRVLMIGDAPGDRKAADGNGALFFPVNPGDEDASWDRLLNEGLPEFFGGTFAGAYQEELIETFEALLPETPSW